MANRVRDDFILKAAQRSALARVDPAAARELAADLFLDCWFRIDLYVKEPARSLGDGETRSARLAGCWMATAAPDEITYSARTPAGTIRFDNAAARAIVRRLDQGPATFGEIAAAHPAMTPADVLNSGDALFIAGHIVPVAPLDDDAAVGPVNRWIADPGAGAKINALLMPHGPSRSGRPISPQSWTIPTPGADSGCAPARVEAPGTAAKAMAPRGRNRVAALSVHEHSCGLRRQKRFAFRRVKPCGRPPPGSSHRSESRPATRRWGCRPP